jgi:bacteriorhodopsin
MKSVLTAAWFCNNAFGNLFVVAFTELRPVDVQSQEYFIYAILMFLSIIVFTAMASDYQYNNVETSDNGVIETFIYVDELQASNLEINRV